MVDIEAVSAQGGAQDAPWLSSVPCEVKGLGDVGFTPASVLKGLREQGLELAIMASTTDMMHRHRAEGRLVKAGAQWPSRAIYIAATLTTHQQARLCGTSLGLRALFDSTWLRWPGVGTANSQVLYHPAAPRNDGKRCCEETQEHRRRSGLHYDETPSLLIVVTGRKTVWLAKSVWTAGSSVYPKLDPNYTDGRYLNATGAESMRKQPDHWQKHELCAGMCLLLKAKHAHDVASDPGTLAVSVDVTLYE